MEGHNPAPDIGLGTVILAGMGGTVLTAVFFLLVSWAGFEYRRQPPCKDRFSEVVRGGSCPAAQFIILTSTRLSFAVGSDL